MSRRPCSEAKSRSHCRASRGVSAVCSTVSPVATAVSCTVSLVSRTSSDGSPGHRHPAKRRGESHLLVGRWLTSGRPTGGCGLTPLPKRPPDRAALNRIAPTTCRPPGFRAVFRVGRPPELIRPSVVGPPAVRRDYGNGALLVNVGRAQKTTEVRSRPGGTGSPRACRQPPAAARPARAPQRLSAGRRGRRIP